MSHEPWTMNPDPLTLNQSIYTFPEMHFWQFVLGNCSQKHTPEIHLENLVSRNRLSEWVQLDPGQSSPLTFTRHIGELSKSKRTHPPKASRHPQRSVEVIGDSRVRLLFETFWANSYFVCASFFVLHVFVIFAGFVKCDENTWTPIPGHPRRVL